MYIYLDRLEFYFEALGKADAMPILMLNGFGLDSSSTIGMMEPIFSKTDEYRRIYFDLPGTGKTKAFDWIRNADVMLELVLEFIDKLIGNQEILIAGYSYGGYLARGILEKRGRVKGMLLLCPVVFPDYSKRELPEQQVLLKDEAFLAKLHPDERDKLSSVLQTEYVWHRLQTEIFPSFEESDDAFLKGYRRDGYAFSFDPDLGIHDIPVAILTGRQDSTVGWKDALKLLQQYPRASYTILDLAGHDLHLEQPQLFEAFVQGWLRQVQLKS